MRANLQPAVAPGHLMGVVRHGDGVTFSQRPKKYWVEATYEGAVGVLVQVRRDRDIGVLPMYVRSQRTHLDIDAA